MSWHKIRQEVINRFNGHCGYCGDKPDRLQVDHIQPQCRKWVLEKRGVSIDDPSNLMPACAKCNNFKSNMTLETFRKEISKQVDRARSYSVNFRTAERFKQITVTESPIIFYFESFANKT